MLRRILCLLAFFGVGCADGGGAKSVFAKAAPSIIVVIGQNADGKPISQGSGVVIGEGVAITNCHVIEGAAKVRVRQAADAQADKSYLMDAKVTTRDEVRDLCLLHAPDLTKPPAAKVAKIGSAEGLAVGEEVYAIGAPQGLDLSLSRGIVAQLRSGLSGTKGKAPLVQTDAATSPGSSGGGLFNNKGELVGITTFKRTGGENLNFAMPVEDIAELTQANAAWQECAAKPNYQCVMALAEQAVQKISNIYEHAVALRVIASAQAQAGDLQGAKKNFAGAVQSAQQIDKVSDHIEILLGIAIAQANAGDLRGARKVFANAEQSAQQLKDIFRIKALGEIAVAQAESGDMQGARRVFAHAVQVAKPYAGSVSSCCSGMTTFRILGGGAHNYIAIAQVKAGDIQGAKQTIKEIVPPSYRYEALRNISYVQAKAGDIQGAKQTAQQIGDHNRSDALNDIISLQAQVGDIAGVKHTAQQFNTPARVLENIASEQARAGDVSGAKQIFALATQAAQQIDNNYDSNSALRNIARAQAEIGDIQGAKQTAQQIDNNNMKTKALKDIASARDLASNITNKKQAVQAHNTKDVKQAPLQIVIAQAQEGNFDAAMRLTQSMGNFHKAVALASIAKSLAAKNAAVL